MRWHTPLQLSTRVKWFRTRHVVHKVLITSRGVHAYLIYVSNRLLIAAATRGHQSAGSALHAAMEEAATRHATVRHQRVQRGRVSST
jgi:hypothetical protein